MTTYTGTYEELYAAQERDAPIEEFGAILKALELRHGSDKGGTIYQRCLQDYEFAHWSDEERDIQYPGWREW